MTATIKARIAGHCFSEACAKHGGNIKRGVVKDVPKSAIDCPDCKSILVWKRVGAFRNPGLRASKKDPEL